MIWVWSCSRLERAVRTPPCQFLSNFSSPWSKSSFTSTTSHSRRNRVHSSAPWRRQKDTRTILDWFFNTDPMHCVHYFELFMALLGVLPLLASVFSSLSMHDIYLESTRCYLGTWVQSFLLGSDVPVSQVCTETLGI